MWLRSDLFNIYRIYPSFDLGRIAVFSFRFIHKLPGLVICLIGCKLFVYHDKLVKPIRLIISLALSRSIHSWVCTLLSSTCRLLDLAVWLLIGIGSSLPIRSISLLLHAYLTRSFIAFC